MLAGKQLIIAGGIGRPEVTPENIDHCGQILDRVEERVNEIGCDAGARSVGTEQASNSALYLAGLLTS